MSSRLDAVGFTLDGRVGLTSMPTINRGEPFSPQAIALAQELRLEREPLEVGDYFVSAGTGKVELVGGEGPLARCGQVWVPKLDQVVVLVVGALTVHAHKDARQGWSMALRAIANTMEHTSDAIFDPVYAALLTYRELVAGRRSA